MTECILYNDHHLGSGQEITLLPGARVKIEDEEYILAEEGSVELNQTTSFAKIDKE